jgi:hypothetical protein
MLSLPPPGEYGTTKVTGLSGNLSAWACAADTVQPKADAIRTAVIHCFMVCLLVDYVRRQNRAGAAAAFW